MDAHAEPEARMIFCQACGAQNTDDAKFCNMCGARIAQAGEPGGPLPAAPPPEPGRPAAGGAQPGAGSTASGRSHGSLAYAPNAMNDTSSITLTGIGVPSPAKTWGILIGGALLFLLVGAGGAYVAMHSGDTAPPPTTSAEDDGTLTPPDTTPVEIGDPVPAGEDTPDDGVVISSGPRVREGSGGSSARGGSGAGGTRTSGSGGTSGGSGGSGSGATTGGSGSGATTGGSGSGGGTTTSAGGSGSGSGSSAGSTSGSTSGSGSGSAGGGAGSGSGTGAGSTETGSGSGSTTGSTTGTTDWAAMEDTVGAEEPDLVMEHYSVSVRRFIRNYYAQRAAACFDHETRTTGQAVRGTVVVGFTIGADGHVRDATVSRNTTGSATLGTCLQRNVAGWELPVPPNREPIDMEMPFSR